MADVFLSYARDEASRADEIRRALEALDVSVFFDVERLDAGDEWSDVLDRELKAAGSVVALWSPHALSRPWVRKECALAQARGVLLPALLEPVSDLEMPVQFAGLQRVDLSDFHGQSDHPGWRKLVRALARTLKRNDLLAAQIAALKEDKQTAKVRAELEAAQTALAKLRKSKRGGLSPWLLLGLTVALAAAAIGTWWGLASVQPTGLYQEACERGEAEACTSLANLLEHGAGTARDDVKAAELYDRACRGGDSRACYSLGFMYETGKGVSLDQARAIVLYDVACDDGDERACANLGFIYAMGSADVPQDLALGQSLLRKACDGGFQNACPMAGPPVQ